MEIPILSIKKLSVAMNKKEILNNLSCTITNKSIICIIAPNGSGKTTLFKTINNQIAPKSGEIILQSFNKDQGEKYNKNLFFLENTDSLFQNLTAYENISFISKLWKNNCNIEQIIDLVGIQSYKDKLVKNMSLGMKQIVLIAVAIASGAKFLIFDEPLNALDIENIDLVTNVFLTLKNQGRTILLSSHNIFESSKICDEIFFLVDGSLKEAPLEYTQIKQFYFENFS